MLANPFTKALWDGRRSLFGWALATGAVSLLYALFYPSISKPDVAQSIQNLPQNLRESFGLTEVTTPAGYLGSYIFGLIAPILLAIFMVIYGSRAVAGDEEAGQLDLVMAHPVSRLRLALCRFGALVVAAVAVSAVVYLLLLAVSGAAKFSSIGAGKLGAACLQLAVFGILIGALSFAVGAATGRRSVAVAVGTVVLVLGYFANNLAPQVHGLSWIQQLSPFHWYLGGQPLVHGLQVGGTLLALGVAAALTVLGLARFDRRDLTV